MSCGAAEASIRYLTSQDELLLMYDGNIVYAERSTYLWMARYLVSSAVGVPSSLSSTAGFDREEPPLVVHTRNATRNCPRSKFSTLLTAPEEFLEGYTGRKIQIGLAG